MTNLCYTLEEAAECLKLSETVLVRLSQYFKVPKEAYEEVGYLSFKGDLTFGEDDLAFFRQAKERLVLGESLDGIKRHLQAAPRPHTQAQPRIDTGAIPQAAATGRESELGGQAYTSSEPPMREIQDRKPYEKAAAKSFERYKSLHRPGLGKVFQNMLKEVAPAGTSTAADASHLPGFRPLCSKKPLPNPDSEPVGKRDSKPNHEEGLLPFNRKVHRTDRATVQRPAMQETSWEQIIHQAVNRPRTLNTQLKNAAILLRERVLGESENQDKFLR